MSFQSRLARLEDRASRRAASVHPLHEFMALAAGNPEISDLMDELAERFYPAPPADPPMDASADELMSDLEILLLKNGVPL